MDLEVTPISIKGVLRDLLMIGNSSPFRNYYNWVIQAISEEISDDSVENIFELGAGMCPITKMLILSKPIRSSTINIIPTDLHPDIKQFKRLQNMDERVKPVFGSFDYSQLNNVPPKSIAVLSATFHHIPEESKLHVLNSLMNDFDKVFIFEPIRNKLSSYLFVSCALFGGFALPFFLIRKGSFLRSMLWCWLIPICPFLFLWDGWVSCSRCWSVDRWKQIPGVKLKMSRFCIFSNCEKKILTR